MHQRNSKQSIMSAWQRSSWRHQWKRQWRLWRRNGAGEMKISGQWQQWRKRKAKWNIWKLATMLKTSRRSKRRSGYGNGEISAKMRRNNVAKIYQRRKYRKKKAKEMAAALAAIMWRKRNGISESVIMKYQRSNGKRYRLAMAAESESYQ